MRSRNASIVVPTTATKTKTQPSLHGYVFAEGDVAAQTEAAAVHDAAEDVVVSGGAAGPSATACCIETSTCWPSPPASRDITANIVPLAAMVETVKYAISTPMTYGGRSANPTWFMTPPIAWPMMSAPLKRL